MAATAIPKPKWRIIYEQEAARHHVPVEMMLSPSRKREIAVARWKAWARMQTELGWAPTLIGRRTRKHRSSVIHGLRKLRQEKLPYADLKAKFKMTGRWASGAA